MLRLLPNDSLPAKIKKCPLPLSFQATSYASALGKRFPVSPILVLLTVHASILSKVAQCRPMPKRLPLSLSCCQHKRQLSDKWLLAVQNQETSPILVLRTAYAKQLNAGRSQRDFPGSCFSDSMCSGSWPNRSMSAEVFLAKRMLDLLSGGQEMSLVVVLQPPYALALSKFTQRRPKPRDAPVFCPSDSISFGSRPSDLMPAEVKRCKRLDLPIAHSSQSLEDLHVFLTTKKKRYSTGCFCVWFWSGVWTSSLASEHFHRTVLAQIGSYWLCCVNGVEECAFLSFVKRLIPTFMDPALRVVFSRLIVQGWRGYGYMH